MTYRELKEDLNKLSEDQLSADVVVYLEGPEEYMPITKAAFAHEDNDVLDEGHPFFWVEA